MGDLSIDPQGQTPENVNTVVPKNDETKNDETAEPENYSAGTGASQVGGNSKVKIRPFRKRSVEWLKREAKTRGMSGYSKKKKDELVAMLKGSKPANSRQRGDDTAGG